MISNPPTPAPGGWTMTPELMPCPFCACNLDAGDIAKTDALSHIVVCRECEASCAYFDSAEEAIAAWNRRSSSPSSTTATPDPRVEPQTLSPFNVLLDRMEVALMSPDSAKAGYAKARQDVLDYVAGIPAHSPASFRTSLVDTHEETQMEQHQVLAKWLELARVVKSKIEHGDVEGAYKLADQLASQLLLGKLFGLPDASPLYREDVLVALNAYTESVVERVTAVCTKGAYDAAKHARNAAALDEIINVLPSRLTGAPNA